ncbi:hypothetical protein GIW70_24225 [Pseudomonas syringae]|nr:hypothetical protein [Pseudomonas syringae]MCF5071290.1 hypothetical protein [Pseudomonas syringae]
MDKGTIIYIGGFELPDRNAAAHRVLANGKIFRELGYRVVFIGVDSSCTSKEVLRRQDFFDFECWSVPYPKGSISWLKYVSGSSAILSFLADKEQRSRVVGVVCYNYPALAQLRIGRVYKDTKVKIMSDATEWYDASAGSIFHRIIKFVDTSLRMKFVHKAADGVITTSRYLTNFYNDMGKLTVELPTLFDANKFSPPAVRDGGAKKKFIYVGSPFDAGRVNVKRSNLKERLDLCIDIFYQLYSDGEDFSFAIYGITKEYYLHVFPEHEDKLGQMIECVIFNGRQPNEHILREVGSSDFSIFFRDQNRVTLAGFPSKLAESVSCGTPVISNKMVSLKSYEHVDCLFLADRGKELELVKKLMALTPDEISSIKQKAYSSNAFDYRNYSLKVAVFLDEVGV